MPIFQYFFADNEERLYVVTSEKSGDGKQFISDIFNSDGIFIGKKTVGFFDLLTYIWGGQELDILGKNNRLYALREKENGYKELVVYKMKWQ
jgi:hypothetical protein